MRQKEIAEQLRSSPRTVGTHLEHIFAKLGARHWLQAVVLARRHGLAAWRPERQRACTAAPAAEHQVA
jgi:DNA-binding NarL/FixJ family response regulator